MDEGEEVLEPTFEIASNDMWKSTGEYMGNYYEKDGVVTHYSALSFYMWLEKSGLDDFDLICGREMMAGFVYEGKKHQIQARFLEEELTWEKIEDLKMNRAVFDKLGDMIAKVMSCLRPKK